MLSVINAKVYKKKLIDNDVTRYLETACVVSLILLKILNASARKAQANDVAITSKYTSI